MSDTVAKKTVDQIEEDRILAFYKDGEKPGLTSGWLGFDEVMTFQKMQLNVITGIPGHGKSEWVDALAFNFAKEHKWRTIYFSPENYPVEQHKAKLIEKIANEPFFGNPRMIEEKVKSAHRAVRRQFEFIDPDLLESPTLDKIFEIVLSVHEETPFDVLVLDPWNEIESTKRRDETEHDFIGRALVALKRFARKYNFLIIVVAHPKKMDRQKDGGTWIPHPYDISGSAHWFNKADNCLTVFREENSVVVKIWKVKFKQYGGPGAVRFKWLAGRGGNYECLGKIEDPKKNGRADKSVQPTSW